MRSWMQQWFREPARQCCCREGTAYYTTYAKGGER